MQKTCPHCFREHDIYYLETEFGKRHLVIQCDFSKGLTYLKFEQGLKIPTKKSKRKIKRDTLKAGQRLQQSLF